MSSREQNRAWAMTMAVAAVLAYTTGCTDNNSSSTAESTQTTAAISELESESTQPILNIQKAPLQHRFPIRNSVWTMMMTQNQYL